MRSKLTEYFIENSKLAMAEEKKFLRINIIILLFTIFVGHAFAGSEKVMFGRSQVSYDLSNLENINYFNGSLRFTVPLIGSKGRGEFNYDITVGTQNLWYGDSYSVLAFCYPDPPNECIYDTYTRFSGTTTSMISEPIYIVRTEKNQFERVSPLNQQYDARSLTAFTLYTPDGGRYILYDTLTQGKFFRGYYYQMFPPAYYGYLRGRVFRSTDGSDITFISDLDIRDNVPNYPTSERYHFSGFVLFKNGTKFRINNSRVEYVLDRNGNRTSFEFEPVDSLGYLGRLTSVTNPNGNKIQFSYGVPRTTTNPPSPPPSQYFDTITYKGSNGNTRQIKIHYGNLRYALRPAMNGYPASTIQRIRQLFVNDYYVVDADYDPYILTKIEYADSKTFEFKYNSYGELSLVTTPTGGMVSYEYGSGFGTGTGAYRNGNYYDVNRRIRERRVYDVNGNIESLNKYDVVSHPSITQTSIQYKGFAEDETYLPDSNRQLRMVSKVKRFYRGDPVSFGSYYYESLVYNKWDDGKEYRTEYYDSNGTTLLRAVDLTWQQKNNSTFSWWYSTPGVKEPANDPRVIATTTTLADTGQVSLTSFRYDDFMNITDTYKYDYGNGSPGPFLNQIHTDYVTDTAYTGTDGAYLRSLPTQSLVIGPATSGSQSLIPIDPPDPDPNPIPTPGPNPTPTPTQGQIYSKTRFEYDKVVEQPLVDRSNVVGHDSTDYGVGKIIRGNVTKVITYSDVNNESSAISTISQYDILGNVVKKIDAEGYTWTIDYSDRFGSPDGEARSNTPPIQLNGQSTFAFPTSTINPLGWTAYTQFDYFTSAPVNAEDINGTISKTIYNDSLDRPTQSVMAVGTAFERQTSIVYDDANRRIQTTSDLNALNDNLLKSEDYYDGLGRTFESRKYEANGSYISTKSVPFAVIQDPLTSQWRVASKISNPYRPDAGETAVWTTSLVDELGRPSKVITPDGAIAKTDYSGNATTVTDQAGKLRRSVTSALGQLVRVDEPDAGGQLGAVDAPVQPTYYSYDALNNLITVNQGVQMRSFSYDSLSRLLSAANPESGTINYQYDANGNLTRKNEARGVRTDYVYDGLNRVTNRNYSLTGPTPPNYQATPDVSYFYDNLPNAKGKLIKVTNGTGTDRSTTEYTAFDILGRVTASKQTTDGQAYTIGYAYNLSGALTEETYPSGRVVKNVLDTNGDLSIVQSGKCLDAVPGTTATCTNRAGFWNYADSFTYNASGAVTSMQLGNGRWESTVFNSRLQPTQIALGQTQGTTNLLKLDYEYGMLNGSGQIIAGTNNGNLGKQKITVPSVGQSAGFTAQHYYGYDSLNRLQSAVENIETPGQPIAFSWRQTFTFDRYGNRRFDQPNTTFPTFETPNISNPQTDASNNRFTTGQGYAFDFAGNLITDATGRSFIYDAENKQTEVKNSQQQTIGQYFFDGDGKRVKKVVPSTGEVTIFVYDASGKLVAEYSTNVTPAQDAKVQYLTNDNLGTPRINTDRNGNVISRSDYMPYGEEIIALGGRISIDKYVADDVRQGFTGYINDEETGLDFAQARMYSNRLGRFSTTDPSRKSVQIENPQTWNRYSYCYNYPLSLIDENGKWPSTTHDDLIQRSFRGLSETQQGLIQTGSRNIDRIAEGKIASTLWPSEAPKHAMTPDGMTADEAFQKSTDYLRATLKEVQSLQRGYEKLGGQGLSGSALIALGEATHVYEDMTSPEHGFDKVYKIPTMTVLVPIPGQIGSFIPVTLNDVKKWKQELEDHSSKESGKPTDEQTGMTEDYSRTFFLVAFGKKRFEEAVKDPDERKRAYDLAKTLKLKY